MSNTQSGTAVGTLVLNNNGTYTYTLNNANTAVNALNDWSSLLTDVYTYTLTDGDGTTTTSTLTITINGFTDAAPTVSVTDANGVGAGNQTLPETAAATANSLTLTAEGGLSALTIGTTTLTAAQLATLGSTPVTITTADGTLVLNSFTPTTLNGQTTGGTVNYTYDPNVHAVNGNVTDTTPITVTALVGGSSASTPLNVVITDSAPIGGCGHKQHQRERGPDHGNGGTVADERHGRRRYECHAGDGGERCRTRRA